MFARGDLPSNSKFRVRVTPAKRGKGRKPRQPTGENWLDKTPAERHQSMTWMQRLKRVFNIDIETCERCSGQVKIIASIEDSVVIESFSVFYLCYWRAGRVEARQEVSTSKSPGLAYAGLFLPAILESGHPMNDHLGYTCA